MAVLGWFVELVLFEYPDLCSPPVTSKAMPSATGGVPLTALGLFLGGLGALGAIRNQPSQKEASPGGPDPE